MTSRSKKAVSVFGAALAAWLAAANGQTAPPVKTGLLVSCFRYFPGYYKRALGGGGLAGRLLTPNSEVEKFVTLYAAEEPQAQAMTSLSEGLKKAADPLTVLDRSDWGANDPSKVKKDFNTLIGERRLDRLIVVAVGQGLRTYMESNGPACSATLTYHVEVYALGNKVLWKKAVEGGGPGIDCKSPRGPLRQEYEKVMPAMTEELVKSYGKKFPAGTRK